MIVRRSSSISWKLTRAILASVLLATFLVTIGSALRETTRQMDDQRQAVLALASTLATSISRPVERRDTAEIGARLNAIRTMRGISFAIVVDDSGRRLYEIGNGVVMGTPAKPMVPNQELSLLDSLQLSTYWVATPIINGGKRIGQLSLIADISSLQAALVDSVAKALLSGLVAAMFGILLSMQLRKSITGPLLHLTQEAETIRTTADYKRTVVATSDDEIGRLVACFNAMMREIDGRNREIVAQRDGMAETVRERTQELSIARDVAEKANAAKSDFLSTMSHEIRTPMNAMLVMTELLATEDLPTEARRRCGIMLKAGHALLALINDILDLSKIEAGQLVLEEVRLEPRSIAEDVASLFADRASAVGLVLQCEIADTVPPAVVGDPLRLQQILTNLINNALKFTEAGHVRISVDVARSTEGEGTLRFSVSDTGIGISADQIGRIFEAFRQADASTSRKFGGTGIGLSICQRLAAAMGGRIAVESTVGTGSTFTLEIPLRRDESGATSTPAEQAESRAPVAKSKPGYHGLRVLAADDNEANREVLAAALAHFGITATLVETGADALAEHQRDPYDLIFMDGSMPVLDGFEATRRIRAWEGQGRSPVAIIALTALVRHGGANQWCEAGMSDCILKPFKLVDIANVLEKWAGVAPPCAGIVEQTDAGDRVATRWDRSPLIDTVVLRNIAQIGNNGAALLVKISQLFGQQAPKHLSELRTRIDDGHHREIARAAHALKSICLNAGALRAGNVCDTIETMAAAHQTIPGALVEDLVATIDATLSALPDAIDRTNSVPAVPRLAVA